MFEATLNKANTLKKLIDAVKDLVDDVNLDINETGIYFQAMDSSHVSLISLELQKELFIHYKCDVEMCLGLSLQNFSKILKCAGNDDMLTLKSKEDAETLTVLFETNNRSRLSEFELKLMEIDVEKLSIPEQEFDTTCKMSSAEFHRIIRDMTQLGDNCSISSDTNQMNFRVDGDIGTGSTTLRKNNDDEDNLIDIVVKKSVKHDFALRHLGLFTKATSLSDEVVISMTEDMPLVVTYNIKGVGEVNQGHLSYFLAPKIID